MIRVDGGGDTNSDSVVLAERSHSWQGVLAHRKRVKDAMMNAQRLVLSEHTMGGELGQPDVEDVAALRLTWRTW